MTTSKKSDEPTTKKSDEPTPDVIAVVDGDSPESMANAAAAAAAGAAAAQAAADEKK